MKTSHASQKVETAFTSPELCVAIACVVVLFSMLLPALAGNRMQSSAAGCIANLRHLMTGWEMYLTENNDGFMPNSPTGTTTPSWAGGLAVQNWSSANGNTNAMNYQTNLMCRYLNGQVSAFKCPADSIPSDNGQRIRTYSMQGQIGQPNSAGVMLQYQSYAATYSKLGQLNAKMTPAGLIVFAEESGLDLSSPSGMDGWMQINNDYGSVPGTYSGIATFPDVPGAYHRWGSGISYADGHAEIHKWLGSILRIPVTAHMGLPGNYSSGTGLQVGSPTGPNAADWQWFTSHCAAHL
jgi:hypothetical protein